MLARNSSCSKRGAPGSLFSWTMAPTAGFDVIVLLCCKALSAVSVVPRHARLQAPARVATYSPGLLTGVRCLWGFPIRSYTPLPRHHLRLRLEKTVLESHWGVPEQHHRSSCGQPRRRALTAAPPSP